jgi:NADH-quinone oxidoreductase subunit G
MTEQVTLTIDHHVISVPKGMLIVDAAKQAGIDIPVFCYHPKMEPVGMCRMCLVEIGRPMTDRATGQLILNEDGTPQVRFGPKLETACTTPVSEGMVVKTTTEEVQQARNNVLEFILTSHPLDCPICDKGGECPLQNLTMAYGPSASRFAFSEKMHSQKHVPLGDLIYLDRERCIQCGRCVRFQQEVAGDPVIGFHNRGRKLEIITFSDPGFDSIFSGNTTDICPVGALTTADFRFGARPWEMNLSASICEHCPVGCNMVNNVRREAKSGGRNVIKRVMPRQNEYVNEIWMCDKGRFGHHYAEQPERLTTPLVRKNGKLVEATWDEALAAAGEQFASHKDRLVSLVSGRLSNEDLFNIRQFNSGWQGILYNTFGGGDLVNEVGIGKGSNLKEIGSETVVLVAASDLHNEAPVWWLRLKQAAERGAKVITWHPRSTRSDEFATLSLRYEYGKEVEAVKALLNKDGVNASGEVKAAADILNQAENVIIFLGGEGMGVAQSNVVVHYLAEFLLDHRHTGKVNNGLIMVWPHANTQGAWDMGFKPVESLSTALEKGDVLYIAGADPAGDDPSLAAVLKAGSFVVVQEMFLTETAKLADVVFPVQAKAEREGTYTSGERRVQRYYPAVDAPQGTRPDFTIAAQLGDKMGLKLESVAASQVMKQISRNVERYEVVSYSKLAHTEDQWPIIGRSDVYYGGTMYENTQGLGLQLETLADRKTALNVVLPNTPLPLTIPSGFMVGYPTSLLYDHGTLMKDNPTLKNRLSESVVWMNEKTAAQMNFSNNQEVVLTVMEKTVQVNLRLDAEIPDDCVVIPRSMGVPLFGPAAIKVQALEPAMDK